MCPFKDAESKEKCKSDVSEKLLNETEAFQSPSSRKEIYFVDSPIFFPDFGFLGESRRSPTPRVLDI